MFYDRKVKYLELWENGVKLQGAGFVKLEIRNGKVNIKVSADKLTSVEDMTAKVILSENHKEGLLGDITLRSGKGMVEFEELSQENLAEGIAYETVKELWIPLQVGKELRCRIQEWEDGEHKAVSTYMYLGEEKSVVKDRDDRGIQQNSMEVTSASLPMQNPELGQGVEEPATVVKMEKTEKESEESAPLALQMLREDNGEERNNSLRREACGMAPDKWQQLCNKFPHIRPFEDGREYLKISPEDFWILNSEYYTLTFNSFLRHGYYNYEHLILFRSMHEGKERYYVGVPGNFYVKEKQVAVLYGFESFEGKTEPAKQGDFGYYMISVQI